MNHNVKDLINPVYNSLCLAVRYLPEIRSSVSRYLVQSCYWQVSFTPSVTHHPVINSLITLCTLWWCPTEWAQRYLSITQSDKSKSWSMPTQETPSEILVEHIYSHPVTLWRLVHTRYSSGVSGLHDLMVIGTYTWHAENDSNKLDMITCYVYSLGLVHHIILLMMWSRYQMTTHVHGLETIDIFDQWASLVEAY